MIRQVIFLESLRVGGGNTQGINDKRSGFNSCLLHLKPLKIQLLWHLICQQSDCSNQQQLKSSSKLQSQTQKRPHCIISHLKLLQEPILCLKWSASLCHRKICFQLGMAWANYAYLVSASPELFVCWNREKKRFGCRSQVLSQVAGSTSTTHTAFGGNGYLQGLKQFMQGLVKSRSSSCWKCSLWFHFCQKDCAQKREDAPHLPRNCYRSTVDKEELTGRKCTTDSSASPPKPPDRRCSRGASEKTQTLI